MTSVVRLDVLLAERKMKSRELAQLIGITEVQSVAAEIGQGEGIRFDTLERICEILKCQPGDLFQYRPGEPGSPGDAAD